MEVKLIKNDKKRFLELLLLADEQEDMIDRYLSCGDMFVVYDPDVKSIAVVVKNEDGSCELKNLATAVEYQRRGYARFLVHYLQGYYEGDCHTMYVGTGESESVMRFYQHCGFKYSHRIKDFFTRNYQLPIIEDGVQLRDMVYFKKRISLA